MTEAEIAYLRLCAAVWQAGVGLWVERWVDACRAVPAPETSHERALRARRLPRRALTPRRINRNLSGESRWPSRG